MSADHPLHLDPILVAPKKGRMIILFRKKVAGPFFPRKKAIDGSWGICPGTDGKQTTVHRQVW